MQENAQKNVDTGIQLLRCEYEKFVKFVFSDAVASTDKATYHHTLVYTLVELSGLTAVAEKKRCKLSSKSH